MLWMQFAVATSKTRRSLPNVGSMFSTTVTTSQAMHTLKDLSKLGNFPFFGTFPGKCHGRLISNLHVVHRRQRRLPNPSLHAKGKDRGANIVGC